MRALVPRVPMDDAEAIFSAAQAGHLRHLPPAIAVWLATTSRVRHAHTEYDSLLTEGYEPDAARFFVVDEMNAVLTDWGCARRVSAEEELPGV
ncbi:DUF2293 domain-containing protein [Breoghania corrubedonensis]